MKEKKIKTAEEKRAFAKKAIIRTAAVIYVLLCLLLAVYSVTGIVEWKLEKDTVLEKPKAQSGVFFDADFNADISKDEDYQKELLYITYTDSDVLKTTITEGNFEEYDKNLVFFNEYFTCLCEGDFERYDTFFTKSYFDENEHTDLELGFTKQRIYDIFITKTSSGYEENGNTYRTYEVKYKIMKNDGTFRNDIGSDEQRPQYITLVTSENGTFIRRITYNKYGLDFDFSGKSVESEKTAGICAVVGLALFVIVAVLLKRKKARKQ